MFRVSVKHAMFNLQDVLLMCRINHLNRKVTDGKVGDAVVLQLERHGRFKYLSLEMD
jgi:hypothetical protein